MQVTLLRQKSATVIVCNKHKEKKSPFFPRHDIHLEVRMKKQNRQGFVIHNE